MLTAKLVEPQLKDPQGRPARRLALRWLLAGGLTLLIVAVVLFAAFMPVPYVVHQPGPTVDVLGKQGQTQVLEFATPEDSSIPSQREAQDDDGQLRMVTVSEVGGPGTTLRGIDLLRAWLEPGTTIQKFSDLYDTTVTAEQLKEAGAAQMTSSHSTASIAAMDYLGIPMDSTLTIIGASPGSDAEGKVQEGDVLVSIIGPDGVVHPVDRPSVPFDVMKSTPPGSEVLVTVLRDGREVEFPIVSSGPTEDETFEGSKMGIYLDAETELPIDVTIHLERIGGPSAGLIFALGIVDQLTPGGITGGQVIAGTGALSFSGDVVPIGGVKQKMYGAVRDGAHWFLAPVDNCADVIGNEPKGLEVIPVATLAEGVSAVEAIAKGQTADLPSCSAEVGAR